MVPTKKCHILDGTSHRQTRQKDVLLNPRKPGSYNAISHAQMLHVWYVFTNIHPYKGPNVSILHKWSVLVLILTLDSKLLIIMVLSQ